MQVNNKSRRINIGNNMGNMIMNYGIKKDILSYVERQIKMELIENKKIQTVNELNIIKNGKYIVAPNYEGNAYLLVFIKIKENYYSVLIDKTTLNKKINYNDLKIISIKLRADDKLYKGTIMDGKILKQDNSSTFIVLDVYVVNGNDVMQYTIDERINKINECIEKDIKIDRNVLNMDIKLTKIYKIEELEELVDRIRKSKVNVNGLIFMNREKVDHYEYVEKKPEKIMSVLEIERTEIPDVYNIYVYKLVKDTKEKVKYGIAGIPDMNTSKMCKTIFKTNERVVMNCEYYREFSKWKPISIENEKDIDTIDMIQYKLNKYIE